MRGLDDAVCVGGAGKVEWLPGVCVGRAAESGVGAPTASAGAKVGGGAGGVALWKAGLGVLLGVLLGLRGRALELGHAGVLLTRMLLLVGVHGDEAGHVLFLLHGGILICAELLLLLSPALLLGLLLGLLLRRVRRTEARELVELLGIRGLGRVGKVLVGGGVCGHGESGRDGLAHD